MSIQKGDIPNSSSRRYTYRESNNYDNKKKRRIRFIEFCQLNETQTNGNQTIYIHTVDCFINMTLIQKNPCSEEQNLQTSLFQELPENTFKIPLEDSPHLIVNNIK